MRGVFPGELWTQDKAFAEKYGLHRIAGEEKPGLGRNSVIHFGANGGYQAVNLAYIFGATRIFLLGFDMKMTGGKSHHHGDHPGILNKSCPFKKWIKNFEVLARDLRDEGVEVINVTRETALDCFPKARLEEVL